MIVAVLCWYDEPAGCLYENVHSLRGVADHLVAVDGAFALYPDGRPRSPQAQAVAIAGACETAGLGLTLHRPTELWQGNEVHKRSFSYRLARQLAQPERDWIIPIDGDERVVRAPSDLQARLAAVEEDVAEVEFVERKDLEYRYPVRRFYRCLRQFSVKGAHYVHTGLRGQERVWLWGHDHHHPLAAAASLADAVTIEHRLDQRGAQRAAARVGYYAARNDAGLEELTSWRKG